MEMYNNSKSNKWFHVIQCPQCLVQLSYKSSARDKEQTVKVLFCSLCGQEFPIINNIPIFGILKDTSKSKLTEMEAELKWFAETNSCKEHVTFAKESARVGRNMIKDLIKLIPSSSESLRLLDLGSGAGMQAWQLAETGHFEVAAVELVSEFLTEAPEHIHSHPRINLFCSDLEVIPFADQTFDVIFCKESLHHLPRLKRVFNEMARVSKPGAYWVVREPCWSRVSKGERKAYSDTDLAAKVGITHGYHCFSDYTRRLNPFSRILRLRMIPARNRLGQIIAWFTTSSRRMPQFGKKIFKVLLSLYGKAWPLLANPSRMDRYGGEFFLIAKVNDKIQSARLDPDRKLTPINKDNLQRKERNTVIKQYNEAIFKEFARHN